MEKGCIYKLDLSNKKRDAVGRYDLDKFRKSNKCEYIKKEGDKKKYRYINDLKSYNHHFLCLDSYGDSCKGIMLTHSTEVKYEGNILLKKEYIEEGFDFKYDNSYFFARILDKQIPNSLFKKTGEFSDAGMEYIDSLRTDLKTSTWKEYQDELPHPK